MSLYKLNFKFTFSEAVANKVPSWFKAIAAIADSWAFMIKLNDLSVYKLKIKKNNLDKIKLVQTKRVRFNYFF